MELKPFLFLPGASATAATGLGGKAENLWRLAQCRVDVPRWIALDAACLAQVTAGAPDAAAAIRTFAFPPEWPATLNEALDQAGITAAFLAVRSSAAGEDGDQHSFAGQLDSCLFVRRDRLTEAIRQVWLSAFGERAAAYRRQNRLTDQPIRVAVIIQEMVEADVSGVAFDVDLATGSRRGTTISAVYGLGEGLVSGLLNADTFYCHDGVVSRREIAVKNQAVVFASAQTGGTKLADVPADLRQLPAVDDETVKRIAATVRQLSAAFGRPQDVEWALKDGSLKILQTRPITTLDRLADGDGLELLWDNSNIVESYPGVTTPLTFSFIRKVYREVYRQFCLMMGVEPALLEANADAFEMLGLIRGRVYYNLYNWYKVLMMLPGYSINAGFMEQMMGVKEPLSRRPVIVESKRWKYRRLAALVTGNLINFLRLDAKVKHFQRNFDAAVAPFENNSPAGRSPHELAAIFNDLEKRLLDSWQPPLINDFFAMIFYGILKKLLVKWDIDQRGTLQNDLLSGAGDIQIDVLCAKLKSRFGVDSELDTPRVAYREKIRSTVRKQGRYKKQTGGSGQFGDVHIIFEPQSEQEDMIFEENVFGGSVPKNYFPAVEKGLRESCLHGVLAGYPVVFLKATLVDGSYHPVDSSEIAFKLAANLAFKAALPEAKPVLMEPIGELKVTVPDNYVGDVMGDLNKRRGRVMGMNPTGDGETVLEAEVPMAEMMSYAIDLRSMTQSRGTFTFNFVRYEDCPAAAQEKAIAAAKALAEAE